MSLMKSYLILQNTRVTAVTVSELLKESHKEGCKNYPPHPDYGKIHSVKERRCKLKTDKITYSKSQSRTRYYVTKNKPHCILKVAFL